MKKYKIFAFLSIIGLLTYCSRTIQRVDPIKVAASAYYEPFVYHNKKGDLIGFEVELIKEILKRINQPFIIEELKFSELVSAVEGERADVGISAMTITSERENKMDFSIPYLQSHQAIVVSHQNKASTIEDLHPKNLLIQKSSSHPTLMKKLLDRFPEASIVEIQDITTMLEEFHKNCNTHTMMILDEAVAYNLVQQDKTLKVKIITFPDEEMPIAIALPKNSKWRRPINQALEHIIEDGTLDKLKKKYGVH